MPTASTTAKVFQKQNDIDNMEPFKTTAYTGICKIMEPIFINQYIVSENTTPNYHHAVAQGQGEPASPHDRDRPGKIVRGIGLAAAGILSVFCFLIEAYGLMAIGLLLTAVYIFRIFFAKRRPESNLNKLTSVNPLNELKWIRIVKFYETQIEVEDPRYGGKYQYDTIIRRSEDPLYCTVWFADRTSIRILKNGFISGNYTDFETFIDRIILKNRGNE
jgi:hypothetical protein